jgi:hypothetical protein
MPGSGAGREAPPSTCHGNSAFMPASGGGQGGAVALARPVLLDRRLTATRLCPLAALSNGRRKALVNGAGAAAVSDTVGAACTRYGARAEVQGRTDLSRAPVCCRSRGRRGPDALIDGGRVCPGST